MLSASQRLQPLEGGITGQVLWGTNTLLGFTKSIRSLFCIPFQSL